MKADFFYNNALGRGILKFIQKMGLFKFASLFLYTRISKCMIPSCIRKNRIDMTPFKGQEYISFADFFARRKYNIDIEADEDIFISPCDGMLSIYPVTDDLVIPMKGSHYRIKDLLPYRKANKAFKGGMCMVLRLEASDYHHFCFIDDGKVSKTHYIPGMLHSVQPIACEKVPVYRLNRRWWTMMYTKHYGLCAQIEVGAMLVGGVTHKRTGGMCRRGAEMGNFELAGSTIVLLLNSEVRKNLEIFEPYEAAVLGKKEVRVTYGQGIGRMRKK